MAGLMIASLGPGLAQTPWFAQGPGLFSRTEGEPAPRLFGSGQSQADPTQQAQEYLPVFGADAAQKGKEQDTGDSPNAGLDGQKLDGEQGREAEQLKRRDQSVHRHEQAHEVAAGGYARSAPRYKYETGPDGKRYAVAGEVSLDVSPVPSDPQATINKMRIVQRAALAPPDPSATDRSVAAKASRTAAAARRELQAAKSREAQARSEQALAKQEKVRTQRQPPKPLRGSDAAPVFAKQEKQTQPASAEKPPLPQQNAEKTDKADDSDQKKPKPIEAKDTNLDKIPSLKLHALVAKADAWRQAYAEKTKPKDDTTAPRPSIAYGAAGAPGAGLAILRKDGAAGVDAPVATQARGQVERLDSAYSAIVHTVAAVDMYG